MKSLNFAPYGKRGLLICLVMEVVWIWMRVQGAIEEAAFVELAKWTLLGFFGSKGMEYLPQFNGKK